MPRVWIDQGQTRWIDGRYGYMPAYRPVEQRFWEKVDFTGDCWLWTAGTYGRDGEYGCFYLTHDTPVPAHRWAYESVHGSIPEHLVVDHLCDTKLCVRPEHLQPKTHKRNILRGTNPAAVNARKTHCNKGHSLEDAHILSGGRRDCRVCRKLRASRRTSEYRKVHG